MAFPSYVASGGYFPSFGTTGWSFTIPSSAQAGDLAVAVLNIGNAGSLYHPAAPAGWTLFSQGDTSQGSWTIAYKILASGDPGTSVAFNWSQNAVFTGDWFVLRDVHAAAPINTWNRNDNGTSQASSLPLSSITPTVDATVAWLATCAASTASPTGYTGMPGTVRTTATASAISTSTQASGTATGAQTITASGGTFNYFQVFALAIAGYTAPSSPGAFTNPTAGQVVNTNDTLTWGASSDPEGGTVTYSVDYSGDGGSTWANIGAGISGTSYTYDFSGKAATTTAKVRVKAHSSVSGLDSGYTTSPTFTIQHYYPVMVI